MNRLLLGILLLSAPSASGIPTDWADVHNKTIRGIDDLFRMEPEAAARAFDSVRQMVPGDPRGHFFSSMITFWRAALTGDTELYERFLEESEVVLKVCDDLVESHPRDARARFYLGGILGYRGLAHQASGSLVRAVQEGREGYIQLEAAVRLDSSLHDAKMGFGLFKYLLAKAPRSLSWVVNLLGFEGSTAEGLRLLTQAAEGGTYTRAEARLFLAQLLFNEGRYDEAFAHLSYLLKKYPESPMLAAMACNHHLRRGQYDEALTHARRAAELNATKTTRYAEDRVHAMLGSIHFVKNSWREARDSYTSSIAVSPSRDRIQNVVYYRLGVSREILGDRQGAVAAYRSMRRSAERDRASNAYWYRRGQELVHSPLTRSEILLIEGGNHAARKDFREAEQALHEALGLAGNDADLHLRILYTLQGVRFEQEQWPGVAEISHQILAHTPVRDLWILPHGLVRGAQALMNLGRREEALRLLDEAGRYDDYDFQESLEDRIQEERERIGKAK